MRFLNLFFFYHNYILLSYYFFHLYILLLIFSFLFLFACMFSHFSCVWLFVTLWTIAHLAPLSMGFSRQEYWSGLPCPPPGVLPIQGSNSHLMCLLHCGQILHRGAAREAPFLFVSLYFICPLPFMLGFYFQIHSSSPSPKLLVGFFSC